jgi:hypothetical protein
MESHGPCTLKGPVTQHREWWQKPRKKRQPKMTVSNGVVPGIRFALVQRIRREIAAGMYETPEKLAMAIDRMARRLDLD